MMQYLILLYLIEIPVINVNSVDTDQMPYPASFDLGMHCLPITCLGVSRLKWIKDLWKLQNPSVTALMGMGCLPPLPPGIIYV